MNDPKEQISARLSKAKAELEASLVEIEKLPVFEAGSVAYAAHALNNFLTVMAAGVELLQLDLIDFPNPDVHTLLTGLRHSADLMTHTVARLMNHASASSDSVLVSRDVDIVRLTHRACDYYQRLADRKQITIRFESSAPAATIWTDNVAVCAVLDNLLSNAIKYSPPGKQIQFRVAVETDAIVCSVHDEGPGLTVEEQSRLFQKGVRLSPTPTGGESSTGYGLAVAKDLVTRLGGSIWCDSRPGQGARFSFRLPTAHPA